MHQDTVLTVFGMRNIKDFRLYPLAIPGHEDKG